jgi:hypothetical protein
MANEGSGKNIRMEAKLYRPKQEAYIQVPVALWDSLMKMLTSVTEPSPFFAWYFTSGKMRPRKLSKVGFMEKWRPIGSGASLVKTTKSRKRLKPNKQVIMLWKAKRSSG